MNMYAAKVKYYDETTDSIPTDYLIVCGSSLTTAAQAVEEYYGDIIEELNLLPTESAPSLLTISETAYEEILHADPLM